METLFIWVMWFFAFIGAITAAVFLIMWINTWLESRKAFRDRITRARYDIERHENEIKELRERLNAHIKSKDRHFEGE